jgi:hypothetical protein
VRHLGAKDVSAGDVRAFSHSGFVKSAAGSANQEAGDLFSAALSASCCLVIGALQSERL